MKKGQKAERSQRKSKGLMFQEMREGTREGEEGIYKDFQIYSLLG